MKTQPARKIFAGIVFAVLGCLPLGAAAKTLTGHVPKAATAARRLERLDSAQTLHLAIGLAPRDAAALTKFLADVYNPASPSFHKYLKKGEFADRFGPNRADYQAVKDFAIKHGLTITHTLVSRMVLDVSGQVGDIEKAFSVHLYHFHRSDNSVFYAPDREPSVDDALPILHISGLDNYAPPKRASGGSTRPLPAASTPTPNPNPGQPTPTGSGTGNAFTSNDVRAAYAPGVSLNGQGQSVGLVEFAGGYFPSDIQTYAQACGIPTVPLKNRLLDGFDGNPGDMGGDGLFLEVDLDIEMAMAMAPGLDSIIVYEGGGSLADMVGQIAADDEVEQVSMSWIAGQDPTSELLLQQMAAQGQTFFESSGDWGADESGGLVNNDLYMTIVGGTYLQTGSPSGPWSQEISWPSSGGGISPYAIPAWQQAVNMSANGGSTTLRNVPDVAIVASNIFIVDGGQLEVGGGTSASSPLWAGFMALVNQRAAQLNLPPLGFANPALYRVGLSANYGNDFHDVTVGNNANAAGTASFNAVPGYDLVTGWGSPAGMGLVNDLLGLQTQTPTAGATFTPSPTPSVSPTFSYSPTPQSGCAFWSGQAAELVLGQSGFNTSFFNPSGSPSASGMYYPTDVYTDGTVLLVADSQNNRVLLYEHLPTASGAAADIVIGQPNFSANAANQGGIVGANTLSGPHGVYWDGAHLFIADTDNYRVLVYDGLPGANNASATWVIGQTNLAGSGPEALPGGLAKPMDVKGDGTRLFIADTDNNRVLVYNSVPTADGVAPNVAVGQPSLDSDQPNQNSNPGLTTPGPSTLDNPVALAVAGGRLFVADENNSRVLVYDSIPTASGAAADVVVGQPNFTSIGYQCNAANLGGTPQGLYSDGTRLFVSTGDNRLLVYNSIPSVNGAAADEALGQAGVSACGASSAGANATDLWPMGLSGYPATGSLYVADASQNRVLEFQCQSGSPAPTATPTCGVASDSMTGSSLSAFWSSAAIGNANSNATSENATGLTLFSQETPGGSGAFGGGVSADSCYYVYQPMSGDIDVSCLAAPEALPSGQTYSGYEKAVLMIRQSAAAGSVMAAATESWGHGYSMDYRSGAGGASALNTWTSGPEYPNWIRLVKSGNTLSAYYSTNDTNGSWTQLGSSVTVAFSGTFYVGVGYSSQGSTDPGTATFSNFMVNSGGNCGSLPATPSPTGTLTTTETPSQTVTPNLGACATPILLSAPVNVAYNDNSIGNLTVSYTVPSGGSATLLVVHAELSQGAQLPGAVAYAGRAMSLQRSDRTETGGWLQTYTLVNPPAGANNLVVTDSGSGNSGWNWVAEVWEGVNQATPILASTSEEFPATKAVSVGITTTGPASVLDDFVDVGINGYGYPNTITAGPGQVLLGGGPADNFSNGSGTDDVYEDYKAAGGPGAQSLAYTLSSKALWTDQVIEINALPCAAPPTATATPSPSATPVGDFTSTPTGTATPSPTPYAAGCGEPVLAGAPVNVASGNPSGGSFGVYYTVPAGSNQMLVLHVEVGGGGGPNGLPTAVLYGGTSSSGTGLAMTAWPTVQTKTNGFMTVFTLVNPPQGSNWLAVTAPPSGLVWNYSAEVWNGVNTANPVGSIQTQLTSGSSISFTITTQGPASVVDDFVEVNDSDGWPVVTVPSGQVNVITAQSFSNTEESNGVYEDYGDVGAPGLKTFSYQLVPAAFAWTDYAMEIKGAPACGATSTLTPVSNASATDTPTQTRTGTSTATPTETASATPSATRSSTATASVTPSASATPAGATATPTPYASGCGTPVLAATPLNVSYDNNTIGDASFAYAVPAGQSDSLLVVHLELGAGATQPSTVAYGGKTLSWLRNDRTETGGWLQTYYLVGPPTGSNDLVVTDSGSGNQGWNWVCEVWSGVNQTNPILASTSQEFPATTAVSVSITTTGPASVLDDFVDVGIAGYGYSNTITPGLQQVFLGGGTARNFSSGSGTDDVYEDYKAVGGPGTQALTYTLSSKALWTDQVIEIDGAADCPQFVTTEALRMPGLLAKHSPTPASASGWPGGMITVPNPVRASALVAFGLNGPATVSLLLTDISGKVVAHWDLGYLDAGRQTYTVNLQSCASGIYLLTRLEDHGNGFEPVETEKVALVH